MAFTTVFPPFKVFTDTDGTPLENGFLYFGTAGLDPEENPITVYWDGEGVDPAAQPIRTLAGYPSRAGSPGNLYISGDYSVTVKDKNGELVFPAPNNTFQVNVGNVQAVVEYPTVTGVDGLLADTRGYEFFTVGDYVRVIDGNFVYKALASGGSGDVTNSATTPVQWQNIPAATGYNVKAFGAEGDGVTEDAPAIQAAFDAAKAAQDLSTVIFPQGTYLIGTELDYSTVSLTGPKGQALLKSNGLLSSEYVLKNSAAIVHGDARISIENLQIDGNSECGGIYCEVRHHNFWNLYISHCDVTTTTAGLMLHRNTQDINGVHLEDCGIAIDLDGVTQATVAGTRIRGTTHISNCDIGIRTNEAESLTIEDSVIQSCATAEIQIKNATGDDCDNITITRNYFESKDAAHTKFIEIDLPNQNDIEAINIYDNYFYGNNNAGEVAISVVRCEVVNVNGNFFRAVPYCMSFDNNNAGTSGVFEGNALSTNLLGFVDPTDSTSLAAARKFRFGKNKAFNAKVSGTATISSGGQAVTVTHLLAIAPEKVFLTPDTSEDLVTITGCADNGGGLIQVTATAHGLLTGGRAYIRDVTGTTEANGVWTITKINNNVFDLDSSTFSNAYVSGGTSEKILTTIPKVQAHGKNATDFIISADAAVTEDVDIDYVALFGEF